MNRTVKRSMPLARKLWISPLILVLGYFVSMMLGFVLSRETERRLRAINMVYQPVADASRAALNAFDEQINLYRTAVIVGEEMLIRESAADRGREAKDALDQILGITAPAVENKDEVSRLRLQLERFISQAETVYVEMSAAFGEEEAWTSPERATAQDSLEDQALKLASETQGLRQHLETLSRQAADDLSQELEAINRATRLQGYRTLGTFLVVAVLSLLLITIIIRRAILKPMTRIVAIAETVSAGGENIDWLPDTGDEIGVLNSSLKLMTENLARMVAARERMDSELRIAHDIQMDSLPRQFPAFPDRPEIDLHAVLEPAKEVGGDFYDFFFSDDEHLWFVIGDVSGKGIPAALFMSAAKTLIKTHATHLVDQADGAPRPDLVLDAVNRELALNNTACMFTTVFCGVLNMVSGEMVYTNAGHNPPCLLRRGRDPELIARSNCGVVGPMEDAVFSGDVCRLLPCDTLLLYTDGVTEAMNDHRQQYKEQRLKEALIDQAEAPAENIIETLMADVRRFTDGTPQSDDITVLAVRYKPAKSGRNSKTQNTKYK